MKKSKKDIIEIRKFMECYLGEPYERTMTKKQRKAMEELEVKKLLNIPISKKDKKRLKKATKFCLTHKGMTGYLIEHGIKTPTRVSYTEAERQDYDGKKYVYVSDDTKNIIPYKVPKPLFEKDMEDEAKSMKRTNQILKNRIDTLAIMMNEYKEKGDIETYLMVKNLWAEARTELYKIFLKEKERDKEVSDVDYGTYNITEKENRNAEHDRIYSYGRRK